MSNIAVLLFSSPFWYTEVLNLESAGHCSYYRRPWSDHLVIFSLGSSGVSNFKDHDPRENVEAAFLNDLQTCADLGLTMGVILISDEAPSPSLPSLDVVTVTSNLAFSSSSSTAGYWWVKGQVRSGVRHIAYPRPVESDQARGLLRVEKRMTSLEAPQSRG